MSDPGFATVASIRPVAAVAVPLVVAVAVAVTSRPNRRATLTTAATVVTFSVVVGTIPELFAGRIHVTDFGPIAPAVTFSLRVDPLGLLFGLLVSGLYLTVLPFSNAYAERRGAPLGPRYSACLLASLGATMGIAFAGNLLVLFAFFELLTLASYPLIANDETPASRRAGYVYLAYAFSGGILVLGGLRVVYSLSGTVAFVPGGVPDLTASAATDPGTAAIGFGLLFAGFGVRAALLPVHSWLLRARAAPMPAFALVFAVIVLKAGVFGISRTVLETFGTTAVEAIGAVGPTIAIAAVTVVLANLLAIRTSDLVGRVTYLSIAGGAYVVLGVVVSTPMAIAGSLFHLVTHAVGSLTVILAICVLRAEYDVRSVDDLSGVSDRLPIAMATFTVGAGSLIGIPALAGFVGTWYLLVGSASAGSILVAVTIFGSAVFHVVALWPPISIAYFGSSAGLDPAFVLDRSRRWSRFPKGGGEGENGGSRPGDGDENSNSIGKAEHRRRTPSNGPAGFDRIDVEVSLLWPLLVLTVFLVGTGLVPERLFMLEIVRIAVESTAEVSVP